MEEGLVDGPLLPEFDCGGACDGFGDGALEDADVGGGAGEDLVHDDGPGADGGPCGGEVEDFEWSGSLSFLLSASASKLS